jgi:hypothetical protein
MSKIEPMKLTAQDRCDRCGAQAFAKVELIGGGELLFCAHHAREHLPKLKEKGHKVMDESGRLASSGTT